MKKNDWLIIEDGVLIGCSTDATGEIVIPEGVTSIGEFAFYDCSDLTSITIPNSVTNIGNLAFCRCTSLVSINIPNGVTRIGNSTFRNCTSLLAINIPNSVTSIEDLAFYNCTSLTSINIPNSVKSIGDGVFIYCTSLYPYPKKGEKIIAYKGFNNIDGKLFCRDREYSLTELNTEPEAEICECGIHACLLPIEVLRYYDSDYIYKVEMSGKFDHNDDDSKICATEMRILEKIDKDDLVKETIKAFKK